MLGHARLYSTLPALASFPATARLLSTRLTSGRQNHVQSSEATEVWSAVACSSFGWRQLVGAFCGILEPRFALTAGSSRLPRSVLNPLKRAAASCRTPKKLVNRFPRLRQEG